MRGEARPLDRHTLGEKLVLPRRQPIEVECEHHDRPAGDAAQLREPSLRRLPMVNRHTRHRRVHRVIVERERLRTPANRRGRTGGALRAHGRARLHSENPTVRWLIGARPGTDVQHRACVAERGVYPPRDPRIRTPVTRVGASVLLVVDPLNAHEAASLSVHTHAVPTARSRDDRWLRLKERCQDVVPQLPLDRRLEMVAEDALAQLSGLARSASAVCHRQVVETAAAHRAAGISRSRRHGYEARAA